MHRVLVGGLLLVATAAPLLLPYLGFRLTDELQAARGLGTTLASMRRTIFALIGVVSVMGFGTCYGSLFDGEARSILSRMMWRCGMIAVVVWLAYSGWYGESLLIVITLLVQSSTSAKSIACVTLATQLAIMTRIAVQSQAAAASRVMTLGEVMSVMWIVVIAIFLFAKNQHVINNLMMKK